MQASPLFQVAVVTMGILVIAQGLVVFVIFTRFSKQLQELRPRLAALLLQANAASTSLKQLVSHTDGLYEKLATLQNRAPELARQVAEWIEQNDRTIGEALQRARLGLRRFDVLADEALTGFSRQTFRVHRAVVHPALRISELLQSAAGLMGKLRHHKSPASYSSDQEIFI
ncbi:MAG: hypothetical protein EHM61_14950 [Acidobacteria bacterium]|nr:MAG: hypothetical protein EHM61_14950 [Acidobacteriota bacterium]